MNGRLSAHSEGEGKGCTMEFSIPLIRAGSARRARSSIASISSLRSCSPPGREDSATAPLPGRCDSAARLRRMRLSLTEHVGRDVTLLEEPPTCDDSLPGEPPASAVSQRSIVSVSSSVDDSALLLADGSKRTLRVLVAEDDRLSQALMKRLMPKMGFEPTVVDNGLSAVEAACANTPCGASRAALRCGVVRCWLLTHPHVSRAAEFDLVLMDLQCAPTHACALVAYDGCKHVR